MLLMGKSTISIGPCSIAMLVHQRVCFLNIKLIVRKMRMALEKATWKVMSFWKSFYGL